MCDTPSPSKSERASSTEPAKSESPKSSWSLSPSSEHSAKTSEVGHSIESIMSKSSKPLSEKSCRKLQSDSNSEGQSKRRKVSNEFPDGFVEQSKINRDVLNRFQQHFLYHPYYNRILDPRRMTMSSSFPNFYQKPTSSFLSSSSLLERADSNSKEFDDSKKEEHDTRKRRCSNVGEKQSQSTSDLKSLSQRADASVEALDLSVKQTKESSKTVFTAVPGIDHSSLDPKRCNSPERQNYTHLAKPEKVRLQ